MEHTANTNTLYDIIYMTYIYDIIYMTTHYKADWVLPSSSSNRYLLHRAGTGRTHGVGMSSCVNVFKEVGGGREGGGSSSGTVGVKVSPEGLVLVRPSLTNPALD